MREILQELNQKADVLGSMVITPDGIMVAAALSNGYEEDSVAAFASSLLLTLKRNLEALGKAEEATLCVLNAAKGKVAFMDLKNSYLVVMAEPGADLQARMPAMESAASRIKNRRLT